MNLNIPFNKPYLTGKEFQYIQEAHDLNKLSGDGSFSKKCQQWLQENIGCAKALLTQSCTSALEMAALLIDTQPGDEIIMPSYTFVSTANAFTLRGGVPVFVDIRPDTLNIDENKIEAAITSKTKAIAVVHYAGVGCEMDAIMAIANKYNLFVIEDAAQGITANYNHKPLGSFGHLAALSFHDTKNIISGEGGALLINDKTLIERAEVIREKGTNRSRFLRGEVDKYTWVDIGSSFLPSEIMAAFLWAQLQKAQQINQQRLKLWDVYHSGLAALEQQQLVHRPIIPANCQHNAHMYYVLLPNLQKSTEFMQKLKSNGVHSVAHYVPLHSSPGGVKFARSHGAMTVTDEMAQRIVRLPMWMGLEKQQGEVLQVINKVYAL